MSKPNFQNKILISLLIVFNFSLYLLASAPLALSQSPTPESSPAAKKTIDLKVQGARNWAKQKAREMIEKVRKGQKRAYVGEVLKISNSTIVLKTRLGEKQIEVDDQTTFIGTGRREIEFQDLEIGSFAIAMGYPEENGILKARRVVVIKKPKFPARIVAFGRVTDQSSEEKIITVKHPKKGTLWSVEVTNQTRITKKIDGQLKKIKFEQITIGDRLVAVGVPDTEENFLTAKLIHIIPGSPAPATKPTPVSSSPTPLSTPEP